jgi:hypothetical protein
VCSWLIANMKPNISVVMSYQKLATKQCRRRPRVSSTRREIIHTFISYSKRFNMSNNLVNQSSRFITNFRRKKEEIKMY